MEALQAALQEVMSSPLKCVSLEDMACLARELGIQVDQDFEVIQDTQVSPRTIEGENQQPQSQTKSPSESRTQKPLREPGTQCEDSQNAVIFHQTPVFMPYPAHPWPLPIEAGSNFYHVPLRAPRAISSHFRSQQKAEWFFPFPHQNTSVHSRGQTLLLNTSNPGDFIQGKDSQDVQQLLSSITRMDHLGDHRDRLLLYRPILRAGRCPELLRGLGQWSLE